VNYPESLAWLYGARFSGIKPGLDTTRRLLTALGSPERQLRFLHVAGTNGKGSVCALLDSICRGAGLRTGLYTSPHLCSFRERILTDGRPIPIEAVVAGVHRMRQWVEDWDPHPTFFEMTTALAIEHFAAGGVDLVVLETGMGGRLDATNVVTPLVSIITRIALDHREWLGSSLTAIAGEKAGIFKPGVPAMTVDQDPDAAAVLAARAADLGLRLEIVRPPASPIPCGLAGSHQQLHAELAIRSLDRAGLGIDRAVCLEGIRSVRWPGRFQFATERLVLDGAHNPDAAARLALTWKETFGGEPATVILAVLRDKDAAGIVRALAPLTRRWIVTRVANARSLAAGELADLIRATAPGAEIFRFDSPGVALDAAMKSEGRILAAGSLFLIGELLAHLGLAEPDPPLPVACTH